MTNNEKGVGIDEYTSRRLSLLWMLLCVPPGVESLAPHRIQGEKEFLPTRRTILQGLLTTTLLPSPVNAASPIDSGETQNLGAQFNRKLRPKPIKAIRPKLNKDFAVLLMRSSYNVLDELDCVSMEQFQRDFFFIRQAEYEPYVEQLGPGFVQQGILEDAFYFDFISFAQYLTINRDITNAPMVFEEKQPVEVPEGEPQKFAAVVVKRDPSLTNDRLPVEHSKRVGEAIIKYLKDTFNGTPSALPEFSAGSRPSLEQVESALSQLVKLFLVNGYAFDGKARLTDPGSKTFELEVTSPATTWSGRALQQQKEKLNNDFLLKAVTALLVDYGYQIIKQSIKYEGSTEKIQISLG